MFSGQLLMRQTMDGYIHIYINIIYENIYILYFFYDFFFFLLGGISINVGQTKPYDIWEHSFIDSASILSSHWFGMTVLLLNSVLAERDNTWEPRGLQISRNQWQMSLEWAMLAINTRPHFPTRATHHNREVGEDSAMSDDVEPLISDPISQPEQRHNEKGGEDSAMRQRKGG